MKCAVYCRLSREDAEGTRESESIQNQRALLLEYAARQGWEVHAVYCDEDYSGADRTRPAWNEMLRGARAGEFQIVLCKTQSRFTRDMELVERYLHGLFPLWGVRFVAVVDNADTEVRGNKKARQINGLVNEWYLEDLSDNIRAVFAQKRGAGRFIGSAAAYGYQKDAEDHGRLVVDPVAAAVVRSIFADCLRGWGKQRITQRLNAQGVPSPGAYKQAREGTLWTRTAVGRILRSELYIGTMVQGTRRRASYKTKTCVSVPREQWCRVAGTHEAIVDKETFEEAQRLLNTRTRSDGTGEAHALAGRVFCMDCGAAMTKISHTYKGARRCYLQCGCYAAARKNAPCTRHSVRLDTLITAVAQHMRALVEAYYQLGDAARLSAPDAAGAGERAAQREEAALRAELARREAALRALYLDRADGTLAREQFAELSAAFTRERAELCARLEALRAANTAHTPGKEAQRRALELLELTPLPRALVLGLVSRIEVGESKDGVQHVRIRWKI